MDLGKSTSLQATLNIWGAGIVRNLSRGLFFRRLKVANMLDASLDGVLGASAMMSEHVRHNHRMVRLEYLGSDTHVTCLGGFFFAEAGLDMHRFSD